MTRQPTSSDPLRIAIIGLGYMGMNHMRVVKELAGDNLVAAADPSEVARGEAESRFGVQAFADYKEMLDSSNIDAVCVAAPTRLHEEIALDVLDAGCNLLLGKPVAMDVAAARRIIDKSRSRNLKMMAGHIERYNQAVRELRRKSCPDAAMSGS